jgi:hypothetical protein
MLFTLLITKETLLTLIQLVKTNRFYSKELMGTNISELFPQNGERVNDFYLNQFKHKEDETLDSFPIITKSRKKKMG